MIARDSSTPPLYLSRREALHLIGLGLLAPGVLAGCSSHNTPLSLSTGYDATIADARAEIARLLAADGGPNSISVALVDDQRIAWSETFGYVDVAAHVPPTTVTMFAIGSTSKLFAALAVMRLVDMGQVDLNTPVVRYLPNFRMASPDYILITVRMLLNHSNGFPGGEYRNDVTFTPLPDFADQVLATLATQRLKYSPGEMVDYCNDGFTLVDPLVKAVSGRSYVQFVQDEIFVPLGMTHSRFSTGPFPAGSYAPRYVNGKADPQVYTNTHAAGGVYATPEDLAHVAMMLMNGGNYQGRRILSPGAVAEMTSDQTLQLPVNPIPSAKYGLGLDSVAEPALAVVGVKAWMKPGGTVGYSTQFIAAPEERLAVIITGVSGDFNSELLAERIMLHALSERGRIVAMPKPLEVSPLPEKTASDTDLAANTGTYADFVGLRRIEARPGRTLSVMQYSADASAWVETVMGLKLRTDGAWASDADPAMSYRAVQAAGMVYLAIRQPTGMKHYRIEGINGQRIDGKTSLSAAWQSRTGKQWLIVNENAQSIHLVDDSPLFTLRAVESLPGYLLATGVFPFQQIVDPSTSDTAALSTVPGPRYRSLAWVTM